MEKYELVVGLEIHAQLLTSSKMYSGSSTEYGMLPNTAVDVVSLAHPGTLPVVNKKAVEMAIMAGLACGSTISRTVTFDRKNYFYPDLPKGYQVTQDRNPICKGGSIKIKDKLISLNRIHLEEDAGKSIHLEGELDTLLNFNRAGVPLIEIVSEPDMRSPEEAYQFVTEVRRLLMYLEICDGNMEEGSLRCDANISVRPRGSATYGKKVEVKNMNSVRNLQRAIEFEHERIISLLEQGKEVASETRNFDAVTGTTSAMRSKEGLNDYRYFPEPDLVPLIIEESYIEKIRAGLPSLPNELYAKFTKQFQLPEYDAKVLTSDKSTAMYFDEVCAYTRCYKTASNIVMGPVRAYLNRLGLETFPLKPRELVELVELVDERKVRNHHMILDYMLEHKCTATEAAKNLDLFITECIDISILQQVLAEYPDKVAAYKAGKVGLVGFFMGKIMSHCTADASTVREELIKLLDNE